MACLTRIDPADADIAGKNLFWAEAPPPAMQDSMAQMGQIEPVLARFCGGRWHVLSGYKRVRALEAAGRGVLVREHLDPADPLSDGLIYLHANSHRPLDDGLRLRALRYFRDLLDPGDLAGRIAPLLGLESRSATWLRLTAWLDLPQGWDTLLLKGHLPLAAGPILAGLGPRDRAALEPYFSGLKWSASRAVQWLGHLVETSRREGALLEELLDRAGAWADLDGDLSPQDKLHRLFVQARTLRYPELTRLERRFEALRREIAGKSRIALVPAEGFETDAVELRLTVRNAADVRAAARDLQRMAASERLADLFTVAR